MNGGFPPIQKITIEKKNKEKDKSHEKERYFAQLPTKNVDIKDILNKNILNKMIDTNKNKIEIIDTL